MKKNKGITIISLVLVIVLCGFYIKKENLIDKWKVQRMVHVLNKDFVENNIKGKAKMYHNNLDNDYSCTITYYDEYGKAVMSCTMS